MDNLSPVLVTGAHRSGTTWVGKMLAASGHFAYISEPLNFWHRKGVFNASVDHWYEYLSAKNEGLYLPAFDDLLNYRYHTWTEIKSLRSPKDVGRMFRDVWRFRQGRNKDLVPLLKDPFAVFSARWFARRLGCRVVVTVRHPAAFYSSLKRLDWSFSFYHLLKQPLLMEDWLEPFHAEMTSVQAAGDVLERACLLWRLIYYVVNQYKEVNYPFIIVRHEDLSADPVEEFGKIYKKLWVAYDQETQAKILASTGEENPKERAKEDVYTVNIDSKANIKNWQSYLTKDEIKRVRDFTADIAPYFYTDQDWE